VPSVEIICDLSSPHSHSTVCQENISFHNKHRIAYYNTRHLQPFNKSVGTEEYTLLN